MARALGGKADWLVGDAPIVDLIWASAWPAIGDAFETARSGRTAYLENQPMFLDRNGYLEETSFTFSLSPIHGEHGEVAGLFHPVTETTSRMLSERRTPASWSPAQWTWSSSSRRANRSSSRVASRRTCPPASSAGADGHPDA
jgi:hypothetical protein